MKVRQIVHELNASVIAGLQLLDKEVEYAFASDLMSDVLTLDKSGILLITGLSNPQALRTAEMADIAVVILARNKKAGPEMKALAEENGTILLQSKFSVFRISGELFQRGIKPIY